MVQAAIELVEHPGGARIDQQVRCPLDQVVVIEQPGRVLSIGVGLDHRHCQRDQRGRYFRQFQRPKLVLDLHHAVLLSQKDGRQLGVLVTELLVDEHRWPARVAVGEQELVAPSLPVLDPVIGVQRQPFQQLAGFFGRGGGATLLHRLGGAAQHGFLGPTHRPSQNRIPVVCRPQPDGAHQRRQQPIRAQPGDLRQPFPVRAKHVHQPAEPHQRRQPGQQRQCAVHSRRICLREHVLARLGQRIVGVAVLHQLEMRRDTRLKRKPPQQ